MSFPHAGRAQEDNVLRSLRKSSRCQLIDEPFINTRLEGEVVFLDPAYIRQMSSADTKLQIPAVSFLLFGRKKLIQELYVSMMFPCGALQLSVQRQCENFSVNADLL